MVDISELQRVLSDIVPSTGFLLDNRTVLSRLKFIEEYMRHVPYVSGVLARDGSSLSWSDYFFMGGNTPERLAFLYEEPSTADGNLFPHQAFLLSFLKMLETPATFINYYANAHRDLYYRQLLVLQERAAEPSQVAIAIKLDRDTPELMIPAGTLLDAGQDSQGRVIEFGLDEDLLANHCVWQDLRWCCPSNGSDLMGAGRSAIVYDKEHAWPVNGMYLFNPVEQAQVVLTGRMLASSLLINDPLQAFVVTVTFATAPVVEGLFAHYSSGKKWLPVKISGAAGLSLTFTLAANSGNLRTPDGLPGVALTVPVMRLSRQDGRGVPDIVSVSIGSDVLDRDQYQAVIMTPFGHSDEAQPVVNRQLYLGIGEVSPGQTISLFWKLNSAQPLTVNWQYLAQSNRWLDLGSNLIDGTQSLLRSGTWSAMVPADASKVAPAMPSGRYWFRAEIIPVNVETQSDITPHPWLTGLVTNGVTATLNKVTERDSTVVAKPLPAGTIRHLVTDSRGVSRIEQPWRSWGGRPAESAEEFVTRVAQRLYHRQRALTWPDMVMLLKAAFPDVFEVMTPSGNTLTRVPALTEQRLVVIPRVAAKDNEDAMRPRFNLAKLDTMRDMLQSLASPWQTILILNPRYRDVELSYDVVFRNGINVIWAERELQEVVIRRYMPWCKGGAVGVTLASRIDYYDVMATLQRQPYVAHVSRLTLDGVEDSVRGGDDEVLILCWPNKNVAPLKD